MQTANQMESISHTPFKVGEWYVDPESGRLLAENKQVKLEPKVMKVLVCLAQNPGKVISREQLEESVWTGTVVGYDAVSGSVIKLRKALGDNSKNPRYIETVSKMGYRLIATVSQKAIAPKILSNNPQTEIRQQPQWQALVILIAVIMMVSGLGWYLLASDPGTASRPELIVDKVEPGAIDVAPLKSASVVVLPFKNISDDPRQEYFSDGLTDDIITDLSKISSLRVIARQSAYIYKDRQFTINDVARELDVQYIVEGSVRKSGNKLRVNVQLTNVAKGHHVWAERFDSDLVSVFDIQDEITHRVIDAMTITLSDIETKSVSYRMTNNFEAYDYFLRGQRHVSGRSKEDHELAMDAYRRAIQIDPGYARAYGAMAVALSFAYRDRWTDLSLGEARDRALDLAKKALELDQSSPQVYWSLGFVHLFRKEFNQAEAAAQQSVNLSPNYADAYGLLAFISNWRGKGEAAARYIKKATALNPYHTFDYPWNLGFAYYTLGQYSEAVEQLNLALERNENVFYPRLFLIACYVRLGRMDDAAWEVEQIIVTRPDTTISKIDNVIPYEHQHHKNAFLEDLRKAGLQDK